VPSAAPSTAQPSTIAPSTVEPTTEVPSTIAPTTIIPSTPPSIVSTSSPVNSNVNVQLSSASIAGITIGVIAFVGIIAAVVILFYFSTTAVVSEMSSATEMTTMKNPMRKDSDLLQKNS